MVELCEQLFGSRISTGTVDAILARASDALAVPHTNLLQALHGADAVNMDETGWRTAGERRALWGIFDRHHAYLHLAPDRHEDHAKELLAETKAIVTSDRWWAYTTSLWRAVSFAGRTYNEISPRTPKDSPRRKSSANTV